MSTALPDSKGPALVFGPKPKYRPRRERDAYYTPEFATAALLEHENGIRGETLLDPCCGDGRMAAQIGEYFRIIALNDLAHGPGFDWGPSVTMLYRQGKLGFLGHGDAAREGPNSPWFEADWVITNPPWSHASEIAQISLRHARKGVALLVRLTFLEATRKRSWICGKPPDAVLCLPRISFDGSGQTDSAPPAWLLWGPSVTRRGIFIVGKHHPRQTALNFEGSQA